MIDLAIATGNVEQGNRLSLEGIEGYPGSDEIPLLAQCISGSVVVSCNDMHVHYGDGPVVLHLGYVASLDGSGHASPHFMVHQSYMPTSANFARDPDVQVVQAPFEACEHVSKLRARA